MTAYIVAQVEVRDPVRYAEYMKHTPRVIAQYGGRFVARSASVVPLEGDEGPARMVIIEFPSLERARAFHASPEYAPVKALREGAGVGRFVAVEGYDPAVWAEVLAASQALEPPER